MHETAQTELCHLRWALSAMRRLQFLTPCQRPAGAETSWQISRQKTSLSTPWHNNASMAVRAFDCTLYACPKSRQIAQELRDTSRFISVQNQRRTHTHTHTRPPPFPATHA